jgi:hypothetical protein
MLSKTKIVLAAVLMFGTASVALAGDQTDERGGFVVPGSTVGVNPVFHPGWFPGYAAQQSNAGAAYGYVVTPKKAPRVTHERTQDR